jgi:oligoribonuclease NrnB/cAMP/cGMP phosphodiesterase (DHH superfamily)
MPPELTSIVTHDDFDGIAGAALLSWGFDIVDIRFAGPITIAKAEIPVTLSDIVCDLPYPLECGMWFDHHSGNLEEVKLRKIDPTTIPGRFAEAPSCVRVIYDYFAEQDEMPEDYSELADVSDLIDSFSYPTLEDWRADTPANRIDRAIKCSSPSKFEHAEFLRSLVFDFRDLSLTEIADSPLIKERALSYAETEKRMLEYIQNNRLLLPEDVNNELYIVDLTSFLQPVRIDKKLIGLVDPMAKGYVEMKPTFRQGRKTTNLSVGLSLALSMQRIEHKKDMGEIVRILNIGDGHKGAAAGVFECKNAFEFQRARADLPHKIFEIWHNM